MSDAMTSQCECPRCGRPVEVRWSFSRFCPDESCFDGCSDGEYPMFAREVDCPTCGAHLEIDYEWMPSFFAREECCDEH